MKQLAAEAKIKSLAITYFKQQIPSHNREIRMMFAAETGHKFVGGDFSLRLVG